MNNLFALNNTEALQKNTIVLIQQLLKSLLASKKYKNIFPIKITNVEN